MRERGAEGGMLKPETRGSGLAWWRRVVWCLHAPLLLEEGRLCGGGRVGAQVERMLNGMWAVCLPEGPDHPCLSPGPLRSLTDLLRPLRFLHPAGCLLFSFSLEP